MNKNKAVILSIGEIDAPVITSYRLGLILHRLYKDKVYRGRSLNGLKKERVSSAQYRETVAQLLQVGVLAEHPNFRRKAYRLLGRKDENTEEVACTIDPFCYISHLSAMDYHGLTNRIPTTLFLSGPDAQRWRQEARKQMEKDLGEDLKGYLESGMPPLVHLKAKRIGRMDIHLNNTLRWGGYRRVRDKQIRVSTIGRTFLDMLRKPELCGGMRHVIETFENYAPTYQQPIINEVSECGRPIDKVRAGYILEERLGIQNAEIKSWLKYVSRGSSRILDPSAEYMPNWSETWCLSINI